MAAADVGWFRGVAGARVIRARDPRVCTFVSDA